MARTRHHWLVEAYHAGLEVVDTDDLLAAAAIHVTTKGEWLTGVVSPSLVGGKCRLQRLKRFLGHAPQPGLKHMAVRAGAPSSVTNLNFTRGFLMEGMIVTAIIATAPDRVIDHAPQFHVHCQDEYGFDYAGHPDMLVVDDDDALALVQIKCPSVFKMDRIERLGREDALETYLAQMATEMFICRRAGLKVVRNHLFLATWEATAKHTHPRAMVITVDWDDSLASIPQEVATQVYMDAARAEKQNVWPDAYPEHQWDSFPCSYCNFPRLGSFELAGCTDQQAWQAHAQGKEWRPLERMAHGAGSENVVAIGGR